MPKVLIVDDDENIRDLLREVFRSDGYDVVEAGNGEEAVRAFRSNPVDLVMTDIIMPDKEGLSTIMDLKKANSQLKIIAMSGGVERSGQYLQVARKLGADRVFEKPFDLQAVLQAARELLSQA